jgi:hypothetical protein
VDLDEGGGGTPNDIVPGVPGQEAVS